MAVIMAMIDGRPAYYVADDEAPTNDRSTAAQYSMEAAERETILCNAQWCMAPGIEWRAIE